jgi:hypothetical protein
MKSGNGIKSIKTKKVAIQSFLNGSIKGFLKPPTILLKLLPIFFKVNGSKLSSFLLTYS